MNFRYKGATPQMMALTLLRWKPDDSSEPRGTIASVF